MRYYSLLLIAFMGLSMMGCKEADDEFSYPATYDFENVSYSGQTQRLGMLLELKNYMATSRESGVALDANAMKAMYANEGATWEGSYEDSKQLKSKTFESEQAAFDALFEELAIASQSTVAGSEGVSGVISNGEDSYLVGDDGLDHAQLIEKGLMGACLYYQATSVYMGSGKMEVDNESTIEGEGTEMEHHWDEAFGYFGVPIDFPTNADGLVFWGSYSNKRDALLNCNQTLMDAFIKGRAGISAKDMSVRDEAIEEARATWELIAVGSALHYLNEGMAGFDDMVIRSHALSEAIGFIYALPFNEAKLISNGQVESLLNTIAGSADFEGMNLYTTSVANLQAAKDELAEIFGLEELKDEF